MHPIERLRYFARYQGGDDLGLARECADVLADLSFDPQAIVVAALRLLDAHPECGPLWWVCAHVLGAQDPTREARRVGDELSADATDDELASALPGGIDVVLSEPTTEVMSALRQRPDLTIWVAADDRQYEAARVLRMLQNAAVIDLDDLNHLASSAIVLVSARAMCGQGMLLTKVDEQLLMRAKANELSVWVVANSGCVLPEPLFESALSRLGLSGSGSPSTDTPYRVVRPLAAVDAIVRSRGAVLPNPESFRVRCPVPGELCNG